MVKYVEKKDFAKILFPILISTFYLSWKADNTELLGFYSDIFDLNIFILEDVPEKHIHRNMFGYFAEDKQ